jgi:DNA-directed RNA polymerase subunit M/transcription elongation factor TFIIS
MNLYNPNATCPKCGNEGVTSYYQKAVNHLFRDGGPERIIRTCIRCHYQWGEAPLKPSEAANE